MPTPDRPEPRFAVSVDEHLLEEDLAHATAAGRAAIAPVIDQLESTRVPKSRLKRCQAEGRDGTRLAGCVKIYIPPRYSNESDLGDTARDVATAAAAG